MLIKQTRHSYFGKVAKGAASLLSGMGLTFSYFRKPKTVVTQQYPENRQSLKMFQRFRGKVVMPHDEANTHLCTGCGICETACPNGTIIILTKKDEKNKKTLDKFIYRFDTCIVCNICIEMCPFDAIEMSLDFETAVFDRRDLIEQLDLPGATLRKEESETNTEKNTQKNTEKEQTSD